MDGRWFVAGLLGASGVVSVASACAPSGWILDDSGAPACVVVGVEGEGRFEIANECAEELALSVACESCSLPSAVAAGQVGVLVLQAAPTTQAARAAEVSWELGDASGVIAFEYRVNVCPEGQGCAAAPGDAGRGHLTLAFGVALVGAALRSRRRKALA